MTYNTFLQGVALSLCSLLFPVFSVFADNQTIEDLKVVVPAGESREYSFSDKAAGFYYGMAGNDHFKDWYAGWNIRAKRIFSDYQLFADNELLSRKEVATVVYPNRLERVFDLLTEKFYLVDKDKILYIELSDVKSSKVGIKLLGDNLTDVQFENNRLTIGVKEDAARLSVTAKNKDSKLEYKNGILYADARCGGFVICHGTDVEFAELSADFSIHSEKYLTARAERMNVLMQKNHIESDGNLAKSLSWIELTMDELITWQHGGWGIYAGLPWFTDFWGRDLFISMPGAVLCTGQFDTAKNILESFAKYQDMNPKSETYGRVPNRLNLDGILYNTTDGTPRFVMQILEYVKYTGDVDFLKKVYENVKVATNASIDKYTDEKGYLTHADADTWMDAKRQGIKPCSPRGNRAVDIQALWYKQLVSAAEIADLMGKKKDAKQWRTVAEKLWGNFKADFVNPENGMIYDHLNADNSADLQLRPNTIYAHDMIDDLEVKMKDTRKVWEHLVYPWGIGSLDQMDDQFHPYHEQWHRYHKDDAYHNGTVWLWQNGEAMQRMIEHGQEDMAFKLFENMNRQALEEGAIGSLSECADAWCRPGKTWVRRTGTFLQAWSNAEQIRVWCQYFLGIRPNMLYRSIDVNPNIPTALKRLEQNVSIADGTLVCRYDKSNETTYSYDWKGKEKVTLKFDIDTFGDFEVEVKSGDNVMITFVNDDLKVQLNEKDLMIVKQDAAKVELQQKQNKYFDGVRFAEPCYREDLKSMSRYFNPPLDYSSVE